jgi:hypothetical protein
MQLRGLYVMQEGIRNFEQIAQMIEFVRAGGVWTKPVLEAFSKGKHTKLIEIAEFHDGIRMIHDGHHRAASTLLGGREFFYPEEYFVRRWDYADYLYSNFATGWYTPYDPRTHVRIANFFKFKDKVIELSADPLEAEKYIRENKELYLVPRKIKFLPELARLYQGSFR